VFDGRGVLDQVSARSVEKGKMTTEKYDRISSEELTAAEREIIRFGAYLGARHYHAALAGNISIKLSDGCILCTRHGADKGALSSEDVVLCNADGKKICGPGDPTSEFSMHRMSYRTRPDIRAVVHAHPPTATAFAAASVPLDSLMLPEMIVYLGPIALVPYETPGTEALAKQLKLYLERHDGFLLENHGALTVGGELRQAALRMELLEHNAKITLLVRQIGKPFVLAPEAMQSLMEIRKSVNEKKQIFD
jgi:L-fuculose-phosphate aldolase